MTSSTLENLIEIFDVTGADTDAGADGAGGTAGPRFTGTSDGGERDVVDGSQILAQSIVAAGKALPGRTARSARAAVALHRAPVDLTGHLSIAATFRAHEGIGTSRAYRTVSTAPMGIGITFHDPVGWDGWLRYHHESTFAGAGMAYVRGQVLTADGRILASFTQDAMIRALDAGAAEMAAQSRL